MVTAASIEAMIRECSMFEEHLSAQLADVERDAAWPRYLIWSISSGNSKQNSSRLIRRGYALGQSEHSKARKRGEAAITAATPSPYLASEQGARRPTLQRGSRQRSNSRS